MSRYYLKSWNDIDLCVKWLFTSFLELARDAQRNYSAETVSKGHEWQRIPGEAFLIKLLRLEDKVRTVIIEAVLAWDEVSLSLTLAIASVVHAHKVVAMLCVVLCLVACLADVGAITVEVADHSLGRLLGRRPHAVVEQDLISGRSEFYEVLDGELV